MSELSLLQTCFGLHYIVQVYLYCKSGSVHTNLYPSLLQVFYVIVQFGGLLPESILIQRRRLDLTELESGTATEQPWLDWQYMARNCSVFEMQNNGPLLRPDSVNCLQLPK